jgi:hypothetical protein
MLKGRTLQSRPIVAPKSTSDETNDFSGAQECLSSATPNRVDQFNKHVVHPLMEGMGKASVAPNVPDYHQ